MSYLLNCWFAVFHCLLECSPSGFLKQHKKHCSVSMWFIPDSDPDPAFHFPDLEPSPDPKLWKKVELELQWKLNNFSSVSQLCRSLVAIRDKKCSSLTLNFWLHSFQPQEISLKVETKQNKRILMTTRPDVADGRKNGVEIAWPTQFFATYSEIDPGRIPRPLLPIPCPSWWGASS